MEWDHMTSRRKKKFKSVPSSEESCLQSLGMRKVFDVAVVVNFLNAVFGSQNDWLCNIFHTRKVSEMLLLHDNAWKHTIVPITLQSWPCCICLAPVTAEEG
jgi:hypothetical protein